MRAGTVLGKAELFRKYKDGEESAASELLESERMSLYDYLVRMTGSLPRSFRGLEEVTEAVFGEARGYRDYDELRFSLYSTSRRFNADIWNGEMSLAFEDLARNSPDDSGLSQFQNGLEQEFCKLAGPEREVLLLYHKAGFSLAETAKIMGTAQSVVEETLKSAADKLGKVMGQSEDFANSISRLSSFPIPEDVTASTMALSPVIETVKRSSRWRIPPWVLLLGIVIVTLLVLLNFDKIF